MHKIWLIICFFFERRNIIELTNKTLNHYKINLEKIELQHQSNLSNEKHLDLYFIHLKS